MNLNVVASLNSTGYGLVAMNLLKALHRDRHEISFFHRPVQAPELDLAPEDVALVLRSMRRQRTMDMHAPCLRISSEDDMTLFAGRGARCGLVFFETNRLTDIELRHLGSLDRLFVASEWCRTVAVDSGLDPSVVATAPMGVDRTVFNDAAARETGPTVFLHVGAWQRRKGQDFLLDAFEHAFRPGDDVELRLVCANSMSPVADARWIARCRESPMAGHITVIPRLPRQQDVADLMRDADCGVFPARGEAWNLELLEMMSCGRAVIATNFGGHTEFADHGNSLLIDVDELEPAEDPVWMSVFSRRKTGEWAHLGARQHDQLVEHLRAVHGRKQRGALELNHAGIATAEHYSWERTARRIVECLP
jgi:glycosyltransferase involved in cell wall biosynthesis